MLLLAGAFALTACDDDNDSNPTLVQPTQFVLNAPAVINGNVDLLNSKGIELSWSQPTPYTDFNAPVIPTYTVQLSNTGSFNKAYDPNAEDNTGADFISLDETYSVGQGTVSAEAIDKALMQLNNWESDAVPSIIDLSIRLKAAVRDASFNEYYPIFSNVVNLKAIPYYIELKAADPEIWYLVGGCIGDGKWTNSADAIGVSLIPMNIIPGYDYDKKTGTGEIQYIGHFPDNAEFKIVRTPGDWDHYVFCGDGTDMGTSLRNGGDDPGNIKIETGGYYKITINTGGSMSCVIEKYEESVAVYPQLCIAGTFNDWSDTDMTPVFTADSENHMWSYEVEAGWKLKVKKPADWGTNWGYKEGYAGSVDGDGNLVLPDEGKWLFLFNDIDGSYSLIAK